MKFNKFILIIPALVLILALIVGSSLLWRLFVAAALILAASYLWALISGRGVRISVDKPPSHFQLGERYAREIMVENTSRFPRLFIKVGEFTDIPGYQNERFLNLKSRETRSWSTTLTCTHRGEFTMGMVTITSGDPFGFFTEKRTFGEPTRIIIYTRIVDLPLFKSVSLNEFGFISGFQSINQISPNASSVREYASGDSLQHIHWRSTAHTGKLMVKMFDADHSYSSSKTFWVVMDMAKNVQAGQGEDSTEEYSVTIAASVIRHYLESGMKVGMISNGGMLSMFSPSRGEQNMWAMMESLATIKATGQMPVGQLLLNYAADFKDDPVIVIIATSTSRQLMESVSKLKSQVEAVVVVLLDAATFGDTHTPLNTAHNLSFMGAQVYNVRKGDEVAKALDSRSTVWQTNYQD